MDAHLHGTTSTGRSTVVRGGGIIKEKPGVGAGHVVRREGAGTHRHGKNGGATIPCRVHIKVLARLDVTVSRIIRTVEIHTAAPGKDMRNIERHGVQVEASRTSVTHVDPKKMVELIPLRRKNIKG